jgi:DNA-binding MurR/RpiR family transcriptional regulator
VAAPDSPAGLLVRLRGLRPSLSPAEDRVAERVLADPSAAAARTISELADVAHTSETTVLRFCKRLGMRGYPQLRLALAAESAQPRLRTVADSDLNEHDTVDDIISKVAYADASAVEDTARQLDRAVLGQVAAAIAGASRVDLYGVGASGIVAIDAQQKLHRIGVHAFAYSDPHVALTSAALLRPGDVAMGFSHTGTTKETIEALATARSRGATTVALTNFPLSPVVRTADLVLTTAARETAMRSGATASRIAALTVVDCLYIAVARRDVARATQAVLDTRAAVAGHRR